MRLPWAKYLRLNGRDQIIKGDYVTVVPLEAKPVAHASDEYAHKGHSAHLIAASDAKCVMSWEDKIRDR